MAPVYSSVPVSHDRVTVSLHAEYQVSETEAAKWNLAIINFIIYTCVFPTVTCLQRKRPILWGSKDYRYEKLNRKED